MKSVAVPITITKKQINWKNEYVYKPQKLCFGLQKHAIMLIQARNAPIMINIMGTYKPSFFDNSNTESK